MADPTLPPLPPGFTLDAPQAPTFGGRPVIQEGPKQPSPQTSEQRTATVVGTEQTRTQIKNTAFDNVNNLRKQFEAEQPVQDYKTVLPLLDSALKIKNNKAGDLNLVYAFGKVMDPNSVVREGEQVMATNVGGVSEKVKGYIDQINGQGQLTPIQRTQLTEEIRNRTLSLRQTYNQRRTFYEDFAKRNSLSPVDIVGPHPGLPYGQDEADYVRAHGGTPRLDGVAVGAPPSQDKGRFGDDFGAPNTQVQFKDDAETRTRAARFQDSLFGALSARRLKSQADVNAFVDQFNQQNGSAFSIDWKNPDTTKAIRAALRGQKFNVERPVDPAVQKKVEQQKATGTGADAAFNVGAQDALTVGFAPRINAAGNALRDSLSGNGSFADNYTTGLDANRQFMSGLARDHSIATGLGELAGGLMLPGFGARTPAQIGTLGATMGGVYGANQGDSSTSLTERAGNAAIGAGAGGALGYAVPKAASLIPRRAQTQIPGLVDDVTGELNQPMDAMRPAERVQAMTDFGLKTITPGMVGGKSARIGEQVLNNLPASAGHMEDVYSTSSKELRRSMQGVAQKFGSSKTLNEGGSELQRGTNEWMGRADHVDAKVYNAIPISPKAPTTNSSTVSFLQQNTSKFQSNPALQDELKDPKLARFLSAIQEHGLNWQDLKDFRSYVGAKGGQFRFSMDPLKEDYRGLYAALSEDMRASAAAQGPKALRAFERANSFHAAMERRIEDGLVRILGNDAKARPELAAAAIQAMTQGGKVGGDLAKLAQIRASTIKSGAWDEIASTLIHLGGQPAKSEGRAFEPRTFVNWYADMAEPARKMLFKPELRKALDGFVAMNQQLSRVKALNNNSNTGPLVLAGAQLLQFGKMIMSADISGMAIQLGANGANYLLGKAWTTPKFVSLLTGYGKALASGNPHAVKSQVGRLQSLAGANPELRAPIESLLRHIANDNAVPAVAASTDPNGNQHQQ